MALFEQGWSALLISLGESAPFVVLGLLLAGLIREFIPARTLQKQIGGEGIAPVLRAVGMGAVLPICSCSTIPLGLGMARSKAGIGTALSFMTSAPAVSPVTVILGFSLLGPALLGSYTFVVVIGSIALGVIGNNLLQSLQISDGVSVGKSKCNCDCQHDSVSKGKRLTNAVRWGMFDLGSEISLSLLAGLAIATILLVVVPDEWILGLIGEPGPISILAVILLALPAYTCSVPALLIAGSLIAKGADPSVAVAFLIAGPATNLGELNAIRVGLGLKAMLYYFTAVLLLAAVAAMAIGALPLSGLTPAGQAMQSDHHHHRHLHFGDTFAHSSDSQALETALPLWRWPFVLCIAALACHAITSKIRTTHINVGRTPQQQPAFIQNTGQAVSEAR